VVPVALNGESVATVAARVRQQGDQGNGGFNSFGQFAQIEGSSLGAGEIPHVTVPKKPNAGRALTAADAGANNVLLASELLDKPWNLKAGDTLNLSDQAATVSQTVTVVGFFPNQIGDEIHNAAVLGDDTLVRSLGGKRTYGSWLLKVDPSHTADAFRIISNADPQATMVDFTDFVAFFDRLLSNVIIFLSAIASLALLAGVVIIANTVALAMLERRREIGILKSVGYDSGTVLSQVLLENAVVGAVGGIAAITAVAVATVLLGRLVFKTDLPVNTPLALTIIIATSALAAATAALVAWKPVRVRPLEVLRYE
jgi:predicted lysophospholipase L1 biosynthesis ABC-type transport system permease subunit